MVPREDATKKNYESMSKLISMIDKNHNTPAIPPKATMKRKKSIDGHKKSSSVSKNLDSE